MTVPTVSNLLALALYFFAAVLLIRGIILPAIRRFQARQWAKKHLPPRPLAPRPSVYEVGSPEYNAQVGAMLRRLDEHLAKRGAHIPERTVIGIINQSMGFPADHRINDPDCSCSECQDGATMWGEPGQAIVSGPAFQGAQVLHMPLVVLADILPNKNIEAGQRFYDHVRINYNTQYDYDSPEAAIAALTALALKQRRASEQAGDQDMYDFYSGFLMRCQEPGGTDE